jgi:hypothetical protein
MGPRQPLVANILTRTISTSFSSPPQFFDLARCVSLVRRFSRSDLISVFCFIFRSIKIRYRYYICSFADCKIQCLLIICCLEKDDSKFKYRMCFRSRLDFRYKWGLFQAWPIRPGFIFTASFS